MKVRVLPPARVVNRARHELLAGAGLAEQQHRRVGRRDRPHLVQDAGERPALPHDLLELVTARHLVLEVDLLVVQPIAQRRDLLVGQRVLDRDGQRLRHLLQQQDLVG